MDFNMSEKKLSIKEYSKTALQNLLYCFKQSVNQPIYRIMQCNNLEFDTLNYLECAVEIVGKSVHFKISPKELYKDDSLLFGFSKTEIRTITILGLAQEGKYNLSKVEFESIKYSLGKQKAIFLIKKTGKKIEKNIKDLPRCPHLINDLSPMEAFRLGMSYEDQRKN